jgi:chromate transport protein ChrA
MKYCNKCGHQIDENAIFCSNCGARVNGDRTGFTSYNPYFGQGTPVIDTKSSALISVISFISPYVGIILWLFMRHTRPGKSRSALKGLLSRLAVSMPIAGVAVWAIMKDEERNKDYAKIAGISAVVGVAMYALMILALILTDGFALIDLGVVEEIVNEQFSAFISRG